MDAPAWRATTLLLVEDNPGDADLVQELLERSEEPYRFYRVGRIAEAVQRLHGESESLPIDAVLLDLRLPDAAGVDTVQAIRAVASDIPIVVLTGIDDEKLALACIDNGAQDYLIKGELRTHTLRRAIGYALSRQAHLREHLNALMQYRALSSASSGTAITGALAHTGSIRERDAALFRQVTEDYILLLNAYLEQLILKKDKPRDAMERLATRLGDLGAGPRDLMDVHLQALDGAVSASSGERIRAIAVEGRLLALEMMGLLVNYYRVGHQRRFAGEPKESKP